jgi:hypothetical protein
VLRQLGHKSKERIDNYTLNETVSKAMVSFATKRPIQIHLWQPSSFPKSQKRGAFAVTGHAPRSARFQLNIHAG